MSKDEDPDRPLTEQGADDVTRVADRLTADGGLSAERVLHSGKTRARETAEILAPACHGDPVPEATEDLNPLDDPGVWADRLSGAEDDVMLVGHLPYMERLAARLVVGDPDAGVVRFQQGGVLCLERDDDGVWTVRWFLPPELAT
jgi:phosphohistidine phosphatase